MTPKPGEPFQPVTTVPLNRSVVYFYRPSQQTGADEVFDVKLDDRVIARLTDGSYVPYFAKPVRTVFSVKRRLERTSTLTLHVKSRRVYYVKVDPTKGMLRVRPVLRVLPPAEALPEIRKCVRAR